MSASLQVLFCQAIIVLGSCVNAAIVGNVAHLVSSFGQTQQQHIARMETMSQTMDAMNLPLEVQAKVMDYFEYIFRRHNNFNGHRLLQDVSKNLQQSISMHLNGQMIQKEFPTCSDQFLAALSTHLQPRIYMANDWIIEKNTRIKEVFFMSHGFATVFDINGEEEQVIGPGHSFGGLAVLYEELIGDRAIMAVTACDLYQLSRQDCMQVDGCSIPASLTLAKFRDLFLSPLL